MRQHRHSLALLALACTPLCVPAQQPAPEVTFQNNELTVHASNSGLNQLLHQISTATGMQISGRVADDRVFGTYGPGDPQRVIAALLDGTGTNILLLSNRADLPLELILTPRTAAASPPSIQPQTADNAVDGDEPVTRPNPGFGPPPQQQQFQQQRGAPGAPPQGSPQPGDTSSNNVGGASENPAATQPSTVNQQVVFPPVGDGSTPATGTTTPNDSTNPSTTGNGVKTPQQIFDQLQKLRQQSNPSNNGTTTTPSQ